MSTIYVYSPSGAVRDRAAFRRGLRLLQRLGHDVQVDPDALSRHQRFAGDDDARLAAIARAADSGADVALTTRGGYGLTRILPRLPLDALAKAVARGTRFMGFSDFTALQCALLARTGAPTWSGPALGEDFGRTEGADEVMLGCFGDMLAGQGEGAGWRLSAPGLPQPVERRGILWGGNLAVLASLVGTPWLPRVRGGILFVEDVGEHPYRIERMLTQLLHAGVLARQNAILLGQFSGYRLTPHDRGFNLAAVARWLRSQLTVPVLENLPFGHVPTKVLLPFGRRVVLEAEGRDAWLLWPHGHPRPQTAGAPTSTR